MEKSKSTKNIQLPLVKEDQSIKTVIAVIDQWKLGVALVINSDGQLIGTVTDGDVRRYLLRSGDLNVGVTVLINRTAVTLPSTSSREKIRATLQAHRIRQIPLVDEKRVPVRIADLAEFLENGDGVDSPLAVIMAGGEGKRLRPLTENLPKPMIEIGGRPLLERLILKLKQSGVTDIAISVNYQGEKIENYFKDGSQFGVSITYLRENEAMGTVGSLRLLPKRPKQPFFVMNGDIITDLDFDTLFHFHKEHRGAVTVATTEYHIQVPFGVLEISGSFLTGISEKPSQRFLCSAGIYVLDPEILNFIPNEGVFDMPSLIDRTMHRGLPVTAFPIREQWIDIGQHADLEVAQKFFEKARSSSEEPTGELPSGPETFSF